MKIKISHSIYLLLIIFICQNVKAESWQYQTQYSKAFIENKGQFNGRNKLQGSKVLYAIDHGPFQVYFTKNGFSYRLDEKFREKEKGDVKEKMREERREIKEKGEGKFKVEMKSDLIQIGRAHV